MNKSFAPAFLLVLVVAGCAAPACRPVAANSVPVAAAPPPPPAPAPAAPPPASNEPGYLHASGGAFY